MEVAKMHETKGKSSDPQRPSDNKQKTSEGAPCTDNKGKQPIVEASTEVRKKSTFDRSTFTTPELAQRFLTSWEPVQQVQLDSPI